MKPTFKTTALAILVSLGATACLSTTSSSGDKPQLKQIQQTNPKTQPKHNTQDNSKKSEAEEKAALEKAKAEREAQQKAAEQKRLEEEAKIKSEEAKNATNLDEKARLEREAKEKLEEAKRLEEERIKAEKKAKLEEENLQRLEKERLEREAKEKAEEAKRLEEEKAKLENEKQPSLEDARVQAEYNKIPKVNGEKLNMSVWFGAGFIDINDFAPISGKIDHRLKPVSYLYFPEPYNTFIDSKSGFQKDYSAKINLTDIAMNDVKKGGQYLGLHQGVFTDDAIDSFKILELNKDPESLMKHRSDTGIPYVTKWDEDNKNVNYLFINTPYSTYGTLFVDEYSSHLFAGGVSPDVYGTTYRYVNDTSKLEYIPSLKGDVYYKGNIIAVVKRAVADTPYDFTEQPKVDGTIAFKAHFGTREEQNTLEGEINSDTVGKIILEKQYIGTNYGHLGGHRGEAYVEGKEDSLSGRYYASFSGKEASDIIGSLSLKPSNLYLRKTLMYRNDNSEEVYRKTDTGQDLITGYDGVFGATKQPK